MQIPFEPRRDVVQVFSTPTAIFDVPGAAQLTPRLAEIILARERAEPGLNLSNQGGWHSDINLLT